jgi:hypothetical protein
VIERRFVLAGGGGAVAVGPEAAERIEVLLELPDAQLAGKEALLLLPWVMVSRSEG